MDFLKKFQNVENYTNFVNSDYFKLPNVSLTDEDYDVHYTNFISQGGEEEEETEPAVTLTYKVSSPDERVAFWNGGENIKRLYVDGEEISFDPVEIVSETTEIPGSTFVFDGDTVTCPDSCFLTSVPSRITLAPKDSSVQINNDTVFYFIVRNLLDNNYTSVNFSDFIPSAGVGSVINNKLVMDNPEFLSYINDVISDGCVVTFALINGYSSVPGALEADVDTMSAEPEVQVLDIIMTTEVITGGVQTPFLFEYPGQHTVKMVLNNTDFGGNGMFSYYGNAVDSENLLTNSSENYCKLQSVVINDKVTSILPGTFYETNYLSKVKIGSSVTSIGEEAFFESSIETVIIPDSVTRIDDYAFQYCYDLRFVKFSKNLTTIGDGAFKSTWIGDVDLPASITYIGQQAFTNCGAINSVRINSNGNTVIGDSAFYDCYNLRQLKLAEGVTRIGDYAFNSTNITNIELPDSVVELGYTPFNSNIETIKLGAGITSIPNDMFQSYYNLKSVEIGSGCTSIGQCAFNNCTSLTSVVIPDSVTSIGHAAFSGCTSLTSVVIPDSVTSIGGQAFEYCSGLTSVVIGSGCTSIDYATFQYCSGLTSVVIPDSVTSIGGQAFEYCSGLTSVVIGSGCTSINYNAFYYCSSLKKITCHAVTAPSISSNTFYNVSTLGKLIYPEGSDYSSWLRTDSYYLGYYKWNQKAGTIVATYNVTDTTNQTKLCNNTSNSYSVYKIDGVRVTGDTSFTGYTFDTVGEHTVIFKEMEIVSSMFLSTPCLKSVKISKNITSIGNSAFAYCSGLTSVEIGSGVTSIDVHAFRNCSGLTSVEIPDSVKSIGDYAFSGCTSLPVYDNIRYADTYLVGAVDTSITSCTIKEGTKWFGTAAFQNCSGLTEELVIPNSVTSIGNYAFDSCKGLTSVEIGSGCTSIGDNAFYGCSGLASVEIGSGCTSIGYQAFYGCSKLNKITCHAVTAPSIQSYTFYNVKSYGYLVYPEGSDYSSWLSANSYYLGYYNWGTEISVINCTYNVTTTDVLTKLLNNASYVVSMTVDGINITPSALFQFDSIGEHNVEIGIVQRIPDNLFSNCSELTSVVIPDSVTNVGDNPFYNCLGLESIIVSSGNTVYDSRENCNCIIKTDTNALIKGCNNSFIPDSVTSIDNNAFYYCDGLTSVEIGSGVTSIGNYAFQNCKGLTGELVIPDSVTSIGYWAFRECSSLTSVEIGSGVTSIGSYAFYNCSGLTGELVIPDSVKSIGDYGTFSGCSGLTSLEIGSGVTSISSQAFSGCTNLTGELVIPDSVRNIGSNAFEKCSGLTSVEIGSGVTSISNQAFSGCSGLESIIVSSGNTVYDSRENCNCIIKTSTNTLIQGSNNSFIPDSVTSIGESAFRGCSELTGELVVPDSVKSIGTSAFEYCSGLTSVEIGSGCTSIGSYAFQNCKGLTEITCHATTAPSLSRYVFDSIKSGGILYVPTGSNYSSWTKYLNNYNWFVHEIGVELPELTLDGYDVAMLVQPTTTGSTKICNKTTSIAEIKVNDTILSSISTGYTFGEAGKWNVVRIKYTDGVTSIPSSGFSGCTRMYEVKIADSITNINGYAFCDCRGLTGELVIPDSVTSIGQSVFRYCSGLTSLEIGSGVTSIGNYAFQDCSGFTGELVIPDSVKSIGDYGAFSGCSGLTSVEIGSGVTSIGTEAFYGCSGLTSVVIPDSVRNIGSNAFEKCSGLTSIVIPDSVTSIGNFAFSGCTGLTSIVIPASVTSVGNNTFNACPGLESIIVSSGNTVYDSRENCNCIIKTSTNTLIQGSNNSFIPDSVTSIGESAFRGCSELTGELIIPDSVRNIGSNAFEKCSGLTSVVIPDSVTSIGQYAFYNCSGLTSIVIPDSVTSIGQSVFRYCSGLTSVEIGNGVTSIGNYAFQDCSGLTSIVIPDSVTSIGQSVFRYCSGLESIIVSSGNAVYDSRENCNCIIETSTNTLIQGCNNSFIPDSVTSIGSGAFYECSGLTSVVIPDSVTSIGTEAFSSCSGLTSVEIGSGVTSISNQAFYYCPGLKEITCHAVTAPSIQNYTFYGIEYGGALYVPSGSDYSSWMRTSGFYLGYYSWFAYEIGVELPELTLDGYDVAMLVQPATTGSTKICNKTTSIAEIKVNDTVLDTVSTGYTFSEVGKWNVVRIKYTDGVTSVPSSGFSDCTCMYEVKFADSVTSIGSYVFTSCSGLTSVIIPDSVKSIGSYVFRYCSNLKKITCHAVTAPSITSYTFQNVSSFGKLIYPEGSNYSSWMSTGNYYLGYYNWAQKYIS